MGMFRLWLIPDGNAPGDGAYVSMPAEELIDLIVLEATRAGTTVVGEDLGTVEEGVRATMHTRGLLGTRLVVFSEVPPSQMPTECVAAIANHDLPTVRGLVDGSDADERRRIGLTVDEVADRSLVKGLELACIEGGAETLPVSPIDATTSAVRALAEGPASIVLVDVRDALECAERVNLPGTDVQRSNWSLPLPATVEELRRRPDVRSLIEVMRHARPQTTEPSPSPSTLGP